MARKASKKTAGAKTAKKPKARTADVRGKKAASLAPESTDIRQAYKKSLLSAYFGKRG
jgi:hypothetical protein